MVLHNSAYWCNPGYTAALCYDCCFWDGRPRTDCRIASSAMMMMRSRNLQGGGGTSPVNEVDGPAVMMPHQQDIMSTSSPVMAGDGVSWSLSRWHHGQRSMTIIREGSSM